MKTPNGIKLVSLLMWFEATIAIIGSLLAVFMGTEVASYFGLSGFISWFVTASIIGFMIGIVWAILGYLLWIKNKYAWWITFVITAFSIIMTIVGFFAGFLNIVISGFGAISVMALIGLAINAGKFFGLIDKESMKSCKAKLGSWKGSNIF